MPGSPERAALEESLKKYRDHTEDVPIIIGGKEYRTDDVRYQVLLRHPRAGPEGHHDFTGSQEGMGAGPA